MSIKYELPKLVASKSVILTCPYIDNKAQADKDCGFKSFILTHQKYANR